MQISLNEAIDIHVKVLKKRHGKAAIISSRQWAANCRALGDFEGEQVWLRVVAAIQQLFDEDGALTAH
jgi:hypothetical protein